MAVVLDVGDVGLALVAGVGHGLMRSRGSDPIDAATSRAVAYRLDLGDEAGLALDEGGLLVEVDDIAANGQKGESVRCSIEAEREIAPSGDVLDGGAGVGGDGSGKDGRGCTGRSARLQDRRKADQRTHQRRRPQPRCGG